MYKEDIAKIEELINTIEGNRINVQLDSLATKLSSLQQEASKPTCYNFPDKLKEVNIEIKKSERTLHPWRELKVGVHELLELALMGIEENDETLKNEIETLYNKYQQNYDSLEILQLFNGEMDFNNAYLNIHSGAGGTEACDWALMLYRLYTRWAALRNFQCEVLEYQSGEEAGIKSAMIHVKGEYAHGCLRAETGIHRLVRISPFDSAKRRHTSFCSIYSSPDVETAINVDIKMSDLRIDTYRAAGAGGQHINKTDSAVRLTHLPTNIVVACQAERSQHQNKERALKILQGRLYEHYQKENEKKLQATASEKKKMEWGSQIRSYIFHPYSLVKDHRTEYEVGNVQSVMDGYIDNFINAYLRENATLTELKK